MSAVLSLQQTKQQVLHTLRPAFLLHSDPTAADTLRAYAHACGQDVAAWHLAHLGEWLADTEVQRDGEALAGHSLHFQATQTDDPACFCQLYQASFCEGYHAYQQAAQGKAIESSMPARTPH